MVTIIILRVRGVIGLIVEALRSCRGRLVCVTGDTGTQTHAGHLDETKYK